jgi:hypothetical protein
MKEKQKELTEIKEWDDSFMDVMIVLCSFICPCAYNIILCCEKNGMTRKERNDQQLLLTQQAKTLRTTK